MISYRCSEPFSNSLKVPLKVRVYVLSCYTRNVEDELCLERFQLWL